MKQEKSCGCIIIDNEKVLLVRHVLGHWDLPKGHMENGETEIQTAVRETKEETNIDVEINENYRYTIEYSPEKDVLKKVVYFIATKKGGNLKPQASEIQEVQWVEFNEVIKKITFDSTRNVLEKAMKDFLMLEKL